MVNIAAYRRIYELIARQISFGLNPAEEEELECWLKESEENRLLHSRLTDPHYLIRQEEKRNSVDVEKHWRIVRNRLTESKSNKGRSVLEICSNYHVVIGRRSVGMVYAAGRKCSC